MTERDLSEAQKLNPVFQRYNLSLEEMRVYGVAKLYEAMSRKFKHPTTIFKKDADPRTARYWKAFTTFIETYKGRNIDKGLYFKAQFKLNTGGKFIPNFLSSESSLKRYRTYLKQFKAEEKAGEDYVKNRCREIHSTYRFINEYLEDNGMDRGNYDAFFSYAEDYGDFMTVATRFAIQGYLSKHFLVMSKSFGESYLILDQDVRDQIFTKDEIKQYRLKLMNSPRIREFAVKMFGGREIVFWNANVRTKETGDRL